MKRLRHAIECNKGYLYDLEQYTDDPNIAATFTDYEIAIKRLAALSNRLKHKCWISTVYIDFPHPIGYSNLITKPCN